MIGMVAMPIGTVSKQTIAHNKNLKHNSERKPKLSESGCRPHVKILKKHHKIVSSKITTQLKNNSYN